MIEQESNKILTNSPTLPINLPEIEALAPETNKIDFKSKIVTADLEAIITPEGHNIIYMAAWYNGSKHSLFNIFLNVEIVTHSSSPYL